MIPVRYAGQDGDHGRECQHPVIDLHFIQAGDPPGVTRAQDVHRPDSDEKTEGGAGGGQQDGFGDEQTDHPAAACAERGPQRDLPGSARGLGQEQVREIDAGDEQQRTDRAEQDPERPPRVVAGYHLADRRETSTHAAVRLWIPLGKNPRDPLQIGARTFEGDTRLDAADADQLPASTLRVRLSHQRAEDLWPVEIRRAGRQHADHLVRHAIEYQRPAHDARVLAESARPEPMREDGHVRVLRGLVLVRPEQPARGRRHAESAEEPGIDPNCLELLGIAHAGQVDVAELHRAKILESADHLARVPEVGVRPRGLVDPALRERHPDLHQPIGVGERERFEQDRVDDAEDRRVRANAERKGYHGDNHQPGNPAEGPKPVANVLEEAHDSSVSTPAASGEPAKTREICRIVSKVTVRWRARSSHNRSQSGASPGPRSAGLQQSPHHGVRGAVGRVHVAL